MDPETSFYTREEEYPDLPSWCLISGDGNLMSFASEEGDSEYVTELKIMRPDGTMVQHWAYSSMIVCPVPYRRVSKEYEGSRLPPESPWYWIGIAAVRGPLVFEWTRGPSR